MMSILDFRFWILDWGEWEPPIEFDFPKSKGHNV